MQSVVMVIARAAWRHLSLLASVIPKIAMQYQCIGHVSESIKQTLPQASHSRMHELTCVNLLARIYMSPRMATNSRTKLKSESLSNFTSTTALIALNHALPRS
jgi:hypothetical protein